MIHQILKLKRTAKKNGQSEPHIYRPSDVSSLPVTLPQILRKTGFDTILIAGPLFLPNSSKPLHSFLWQGLDGSRIRVHASANLFQNRELATEDFEKLARLEMRPFEDSLPLWVGELPSAESSVPQILDSHMNAMYRRDQDYYKSLSISGIPAVTEQNIDEAASLPEHKESEWNELLDGYLHAIGESINTRGVKRPVLVFNRHSFYGNETVEIPISSQEYPAAAIGPEGEIQPVQIINRTEGRAALFAAKNVPMHGYAVWDLMATSVAPEIDDAVYVTSTSLENEMLRVEFDFDTGLITSVFDKSLEREVLNAAVEVGSNGKRTLIRENAANRFQIFNDNLAAEKTIPELVSSELLEEGPVRGAIRFVHKYGDSSILQTIRLTSGSARIDFVTEIDWKESGQNLEAVFPAAINSFRAAHAIPYGYAERPTHLNPAGSLNISSDTGGNWVDLSEGDYGVALLNSGGLNTIVDGNTFRLSIVKDSLLENNRKQFSYSFLPHDGDIREGEVIENAIAISSPQRIAAITGNKTGSLPLEQSFFELDNAGIFIDSIHLAENDQNAVIVRLYESHNTRGTVAITSRLPIKKAFLVDLLERELVEIPIADEGILLPVLPFEIISVKFFV